LNNGKYGKLFLSDDLLAQTYGRDLVYLLDLLSVSFNYRIL